MLVSNALPNYIHDFQPLRDAQTEYWGELDIHNCQISMNAVSVQARGSVSGLKVLP